MANILLPIIEGHLSRHTEDLEDERQQASQPQLSNLTRR